MAKSRLFAPFKVGGLDLEHRVVMAPLTRFRADDGHVHHDLAVEYYEQRARRRGTLLITEATFIRPEAGGMANVPGIWSHEQVAAWRKVTEAVHRHGSFIACQLWALGRAAIPSNLEKENAGPYVGASGARLHEKGPPPRSLEVEEVREYVDWYATAAKNAISAGFDLVEIHSANGYLPNQFLDTNTNTRPASDPYTGTTVEGRTKFTRDIVAACCAAVGAERVGIRLSPYSTFQGMKMAEAETRATYGPLVRELPRDLAYLHLVESRIAGNADVDGGERVDWLVDLSQSPVLIAGGFKRQSALDATADKDVAVVFGRLFIANPDLPDRLEHDWPLNDYDRDSFYAPRGPGGAKGYTDYPRHAPAGKL